MSEYSYGQENYRNRGIKRILDGGTLAVPGSFALTAAVEPVQTEIEQYRAKGLPVADNLLNTVASIPLDAKAVGISAAIVGIVTLYEAGKWRQSTSKDAIASREKVHGLLADEAVEPRGRKITRMVSKVAGTALAAYAGYKYGVDVPNDAAVYIAVGTAGVSLATGKAADKYFQRKYHR